MNDDVNGYRRISSSDVSEPFGQWSNSVLIDENKIQDHYPFKLFFCWLKVTILSSFTFFIVMFHCPFLFFSFCLSRFVPFLTGFSSPMPIQNSREARFITKNIAKRRCNRFVPKLDPKNLDETITDQ